MQNITGIIIIGIAILVIYWYLKNSKKITIGATAMFTGAPKTGKSTLAIWTAVKEHRRAHIRYNIRKFFQKVFKKQIDEEPLLYSNIPLNYKYYVPLTKDILERKKRVNYKSVIYIGEYSLVADSMSYKDQDLNERLTLFQKLIGHETKGGKLIIDTQCIGDCHYAVKRTTGQYYYCYSLTKWIPFIVVAKVKECRYSDDNSVVETNTEDVEENLKFIIMRKSTWKIFDCYAYSILTDNLDIENNIQIPESLKAKEIITYKEYRSLK